MFVTALALCAALLATGPAAPPAAIAVPAPPSPGDPALPDPAPSAASDSAPPPEPRRTEVVGLPAIAYDSDTGLLVGAFVAIARFEPGAFPYAWRLQGLLSASLKTDGGLRVPLHNDSFSLDVPGLRGGDLRIGAAVYFSSYKDSAWYGFGGNSSATTPPPPDPPLAGSTTRYFNYARVYPGGAINSRWRLWDHVHGDDRARLEGLVGAQLDYSHVNADPGSLLAQEIALAATGTTADANTLRGLLHGTDDHLLGKLRLGLLYDSRDQEYQPTHGLFLELSSRIAPAPAYLRHAGFFASASGFLPLWGDRLVLAARFFADALVGNPPFYALTEAGVFAPLNAPGGGTAVRGVVQQRFAGKIKLVANAELRAQLFRFSMFSQRFRLGVLGFTDGGKVWADWHRVVLNGEDVDGSWHRFATGVGGGLRLAWGETLVVRFDEAYSPSEHTNGLYIDVGNVF